MKIIIDTDRKEIVLIGLATIDEINAFIKDRNLEDYSISGTDISTHWYRGWQINHPTDPLAPPYKITSTSGPVTVNHDQNTDFRCRFIDPNKYTAGRIPDLISRTEIRVDQNTGPMTPPDGFQ